MKTTVYEIPLPSLALMLGLVAIVVYIYYSWSLRAGTVLYATSRMLVQLTLIGYILGYIFESNKSLIVIAVLCFMLVTASWIALRPVREKRSDLFLRVFLAVAAGSVPTLALVTQIVVPLDSWFQPNYVIPLAGMIFSSSMNAVSLAAERFEAEFNRNGNYLEARGVAMEAALIPITNSLFAVGLVSIPGMMTGQILSGISPLLAARYQIVVMCMVFGAAGISAACYLSMLSFQKK